MDRRLKRRMVWTLLLGRTHTGCRPHLRERRLDVAENLSTSLEDGGSSYSDRFDKGLQLMLYPTHDKQSIDIDPHDGGRLYL
jgi:hypothetical protein